MAAFLYARRFDGYLSFILGVESLVPLFVALFYQLAHQLQIFFIDE